MVDESIQSCVARIRSIDDGVVPLWLVFSANVKKEVIGRYECQTMVFLVVEMEKYSRKLCT